MSLVRSLQLVEFRRHSGEEEDANFACYVFVFRKLRSLFN